MTQLRLIQFVRKAVSYGSVGLFCFISNNLLLIGMDALGQPLWITLLVSATIMIVLGYILQSVFTFVVPLNWKALGRYTLMMLPNVPLAYALLWLLHEKLSIAMYYSAPIATVLLLIWNAAGSAWALQRRSKSM